jgi:hypothetical protein
MLDHETKRNQLTAGGGDISPGNKVIAILLASAVPIYSKCMLQNLQQSFFHLTLGFVPL